MCLLIACDYRAVILAKRTEDLLERSEVAGHRNAL
jgi:hypothetical protein